MVDRCFGEGQYGGVDLLRRTIDEIVLAIAVTSSHTWISVTVTHPTYPHTNWIIFHRTDTIRIGGNCIHSFYCAARQDDSKKEKYIFHALNINPPARDASGGVEKFWDLKGLFTTLLALLFLAFHNSHLINEVRCTRILVDDE